MMKKILLVFCLLIALLSTGCTPGLKRMFNRYDHSMQVADDETNYKKLKQVEDTCRAMIASYNSDKLMYEQYKNSEDRDEKSWSNQAMTRANKTASSYNEYILKNDYLWKNNIPQDIYSELDYLTN